MISKGGPLIRVKLADLPAGGFGLFGAGLLDTHFSANGRHSSALGRVVRTLPCATDARRSRSA